MRMIRFGLLFSGIAFLTGCASAPRHFTVYRPATMDAKDATNEHFLVVPSKTGKFLAIWTQAGNENDPDQRIVLSRSSDRGRTWTAPVTLAGDPTGKTGLLASWAFPFVVPKTGRVYLFWNQNVGVTDAREDTTGALAYKWSDDEGVTWSDMHTLAIRKSAISHPDANVPENWVTYQCPVITSHGVLVGFTRWASKAVQKEGGLFDRHSEVWFLRFDNILTEPDGAKLQVTTLPDGEKGLMAPCTECERGSVETGETDAKRKGSAKPPKQRPNPFSIAQEPSVQELSDGRLITVMRTRTGSPYFALSADGGKSWDTPRPLLYSAGGPPVQQPLAPSPLYKLRDGNFVLIFHNNDGTGNGGKGTTDSRRVRRPVFLTVGREGGSPDYPLVFTQPRLLADNGGYPGAHGHTQIGTYPSFFEFERRAYFFYPDRKHVLYGMVVPHDMLTPVPR